MIRALWLVVTRRHDVPDGGVAIGYSQQARPLFWVFFVLNPMEIALVELVVPWPALRVVLLGVGVLGTILFIGLIATLYKCPHTVDERILRLREQSFFDCRIPIAKIESVRVVTNSRSSKRSNSVVDRVLVMEVMKSTNMSLSLREPHEVDLGKLGVHEVDQVDFWADDPRGAAKAINERLSVEAP